MGLKPDHCPGKVTGLESSKHTQCEKKQTFVAIFFVTRGQTSDLSLTSVKGHVSPTLFPRLAPRY